MARTKKTSENGPIIIKKYANRRLYNTQTSNYITLDFLAAMTREDVEFIVVDAKTGDDITHHVLTQIIVEEENNGQNMLPVKFLRQLISMYGNSMQSLMPSYLEAAMDNFRTNQNKFQEAVEGALSSNPLSKIAMQNQQQYTQAVENALRSSPIGAVFKNAMNMSQDAEQPKDGAGNKAVNKDEVEIEELRQQLADIQSKIDGMEK